MLKKIIFAIGLAGFQLASYAGPPSQDLANLLNLIKSMQASFVQTVYDSRHKMLQQSLGEMALQRPGKFRWQVKKPIPQLIIAGNTKLWIYDPDLQQVTIRSLHKSAGEAPALLLTNAQASLDKEFVITGNTTNQAQWFKLSPKQSDSTFSSIELGFKNQQINEMRFNDNLGHVTIVRYDHIQLNKTINAALFQFKPPANADVIDETRQR